MQEEPLEAQRPDPLDEVRQHTAWLWWPLLISLGLICALFAYYYSWVDFDWLIEETIRQLPAEDRAASANVYNSPGWRRLQARGADRGMSQPREARNTVIDMSAVSSFAVGERVFHQKFGYGEITGIEGDKLDISFEKAGFKKVVAKFVKAAEAADDVPF